NMGLSPNAKGPQLLRKKLLQHPVSLFLAVVAQRFRGAVVNEETINATAILQEESGGRSERRRFVHQFLGKSPRKLELLQLLKLFFHVLLWDKLLSIFLEVPTLHDGYHLTPEVLHVGFVDLKPSEIPFHATCDSQGHARPGEWVQNHVFRITCQQENSFD